MTQTPAQRAQEKYRKTDKYKKNHNEYQKKRQQETRALAAAAKKAGLKLED